MAAKKKAKKRAAASAAQVTTLVNGQVTGHVAASGTIGEAADLLARNAGLKSYSVRANGVPVSVSDAGGSMAKVKSIEVFAKDTRG